MLAQRLQGFVALIRNNMRYYGAMRLDHVCRCFACGGLRPVLAHRGAYVHYPLQQLLTVLSLESARGAAWSWVKISACTG